VRGLIGSPAGIETAATQHHRENAEYWNKIPRKGVSKGVFAGVDPEWVDTADIAKKQITN